MRSLSASRMNSLALLLFMLPTALSQLFCISLPDNPTWEDLVTLAKESSGLTIVCPFEIKGDGCPSHPFRVEYIDLYMICERRSSFFDFEEDNNECIIDCDSTHFVVTGNVTLSLDQFTLKGSRNSAVRVEQRGHFNSFHTNYFDNWNDSGNGGAINAESDSNIRLEASTFQNNQGLNGGAVHHLGGAIVRDSHFYDNVATEGGGGAIFSGSQTSMDLVDSTFERNRAAFYGPAVFDGSGMARVRGDNEGCHNNIEGSPVFCDGVTSLEKGLNVCDSFSNEDCVMPSAGPTSPTASPSVMPSHAASRMPSSLPSWTPSTRMPSFVPSQSPTQTPSVVPSALPTNTPSLGPSGSPSSRPSKSPTLAPSQSQFPSLEPSLAPSASPSKSPSQVPSGTPSVGPTTSMMPTGSPTTMPSSDPSMFPSAVPTTNSPTATPSRIPLTKTTVPSSTHTPTGPLRRRRTMSKESGS